MRLKVIAYICIVSLLVVTAISTAKLQTNNTNTAQRGAQIAVVTKQLPLENGVVPITLQCQTARQTAPREFLALKCVVKNSSNKPVSALSIAYVISFERNGEEFTDGGLLTRDARIHADFQEAHAAKFIPPGGEQVIQRGEPLQHEDASIKSIEARIDYVEFADNTELGPDEKGSQAIAQIRQGATKYKEWLKQKYVEKGGLINAIVPLLQDTSPLSAELNLNDSMMALGAEAYRKSARDLYRTRGGTELEKSLNK